jgi:xanthine dehydrogenase accessory factor
MRVTRDDERGVLFTVVEGEGHGSQLLALDTGEAVGDGPHELAAEVAQLVREGRNRMLELGDRKVFAEVYGPPFRLLVYGAVDTAEALCALARPLGWRTIVADARARFATRERMPSADVIEVGWPDEVLERVQPDYATAIVVLTHDDKFDLPLLKAAVETEALYIGALGSRRNQARRRERLVEEGVPEKKLERVHGPAGLDLGGGSPAETALSIIGEIVAVRAGRTGGSLRTSSGRIHADPDAVPA